MMKGVMLTATVSVSASGTSQSTANMAEASTRTVTSLVEAGKQAYTSPYTVTVKKIEPVGGSNQVRVTFFVSGEDEPAHDFTETGNQVVAALLNAGIGMHANVSGAGTAKVEQIEAVEGGDDDSDDDSDTVALSGLVHEDDPPQQRVRPPDAH